MSSSSWFDGPSSGPSSGPPDLHRTVYVCDWLPPDFGAVGQYSLLFARERASRGQDVLLVGLSSVDAAIDAAIDVEQHGEGRLTIWKLYAKTYNKSSLVSRLWWTLIINIRLFFNLIRPFSQAQEIVFTGSPPFMVHWVAPLNLLLRKKVVYRITDFYPECLMAEKNPVPLPLRILHWITVFWRRRISVMEILGEDQRRRLHEVGITDEHIQMKRDPSPVSISSKTTPLDIPQELRPYTILLYSGNFGVAHDYETFIAGYIQHHRDGNGTVALWLNAVGSAADLVTDRLRGANVPVFRSRPVPIENLPSLLVTPHAHLITLKDSFVGYVMPSKVYGCIESKRRVVFIGSQDSDVHLLCQKSLCPGDYHQVNVGASDRVFSVLNELGQKCQPTSWRS